MSAGADASQLAFNFGAALLMGLCVGLGSAVGLQAQRLGG
jgi:hypothetical protein